MEDDKDYDLEFHQGKLTLYCRLCKHQRLLVHGRTKPIHVIQYQSEIKDLHGLDISKDDVNCHPKSICDVCRGRLDRFKKAKRNKKTFTTQFKPAIFMPHCVDCEICHYAPRRTPRKTPQKTASATSAKRKHEDSTEEHSKGKQCKTLLDFNIKLAPIATEYTRINIDSCVETELALRLSCRICLCVPLSPTTTACGHLFCETCIQKWCNNANTCPTCGDILDSEKVKCLSFTTNVFDVLHVKCKYVKNGCQATPLCKDLDIHERNCKYGRYRAAILRKPSMFKRGPGMSKIPLHEADRKYVRHKRLKSLIEYVSSFCDEQYESKIDALYFMLHSELLLLNQKRKADAVFNIWQSGDGVAGAALSPEECLALKVETLQSKAQYRRQYDFFNQRKDLRFCKPNQVDTIEKQFLPNRVSFEIVGQELIDHMKFDSSKDVEPLNILESFNTGVPEYPVPNCKGVRWFYINAIAKTLEELDSEISNNLQSLKTEIEYIEDDVVMKTYIKDGGDGMGDVSVYKEKGDRTIPDKALRFSFCVLESLLTINGKQYTMFKEENPNSVRRNRPLLEVLGDENNTASVAVSISPIERERECLKGKILKVFIGDSYRKHELHFVSSMEDEKYDRALGGLHSSGSSYMCTLCHATRESAVTNLGTFSVVRTLEETRTLANYLHINPDNLSNVQLNNIMKGVKSVPILLTEPKERLLDATHADINLAVFFKKLIVQCIAKVRKWDATQDIKNKLEDAEVRFNSHIKKHIGSNTELMMPGNYARMMFDIKNEKHVLHLVGPAYADVLQEIFEKFRKMRKVYRDNNPDPAEVSEYKSVAVEFGKLISKHFDFVRWPNYLHKVIEHVQELIQDKNGPGSIGAVSSEGNEAGNKIFRHFKKNLSSKGNSYQSLVDVLKLHWLYSSPRLQSLAKISRRKYKCSSCHREGHNCNTCPDKIEDTETTDNTETTDAQAETTNTEVQVEKTNAPAI